MEGLRPASEPSSDLLRLKPLSLSEIPSHPLLTNGSSSEGSENDAKASEKHPALVVFAQAMLEQGRTFISKPQFNETFTVVSSKPSPPSAAHVEVLKREIPAKGETWFARRSVHQNKKAEGTADWNEMVFALRDDHSSHERDFTPTLWDARKICDWDSDLDEKKDQIAGFDTMTMSVFEMCHEIPAPLGPRCFPVLVMTGNINTQENCFIAVTVPVDLNGLTTSFYSSGRNVQEGTTKLEKKRTVLGAYAAAEKVTLLEDNIEWVMATASDAKGNLPMFAQKLAMPGAVAKDVGFLMKWLGDRRKAGTQ